MKIEEVIMNEIERDIDSLNDNIETDYLINLINNSDEIEERINAIIEAIEEEEDTEIDTPAEDYIDYYIDRLSIYVD